VNGSRVRRDVLEDVREEMAYGERRFGPTTRTTGERGDSRGVLELNAIVFHGDDRHRAIHGAAVLGEDGMREAHAIDRRLRFAWSSDA
jgi:hypothetical protein